MCMEGHWGNHGSLFVDRKQHITVFGWQRKNNRGTKRVTHLQRCLVEQCMLEGLLYIKFYE